MTRFVYCCPLPLLHPSATRSNVRAYCPILVPAGGLDCRLGRINPSRNVRTPMMSIRALRICTSLSVRARLVSNGQRIRVRRFCLLISIPSWCKIYENERKPKSPQSLGGHRPRVCLSLSHFFQTRDGDVRFQGQQYIVSVLRPIKVLGTALFTRSANLH